MLIDFLGMLFANTMLVLSIYKISDKKIDYKNWSLYVCVALYNILVISGVSAEVHIAKPLYNFICFLVVAFIITKYDLKKSMIICLTIYIVSLLLELIILACMMVFIGLNNRTINAEQILVILNTTAIFAFAMNVFTTILIFIFCSNAKVKKVFLKINYSIENLKSKRFVPFVGLTFIAIFVTYCIICFSSNLFYTIIMFIALILIIGYIFMKDLSTRVEYEAAKEKYNNVENSLIEYEEMIDKYRVNNHENKNQLLTIQNMIKHNDPTVNDYIDNLVGNVYMTNEKIMMDVSIIPSGGLRATIHTKLNIMDNKRIKYVLNIDRKLRTIDFENINSDLNLKICKIISIFIDNAIDEVDTHKKKKVVNIEMYLDDNKLIIEVSNKFKNEINMDKLFEKKYTTKSNGHGYGLPLAKELVDSEKVLSNYQKIEDDIFTQILEIEIKK